MYIHKISPGEAPPTLKNALNNKQVKFTRYQQLLINDCLALQGRMYYQYLSTFLFIDNTSYL